MLFRPSAAAAAALLASAAGLSGCSDAEDSGRPQTTRTAEAPEPGGDAAAFCADLVADKTVLNLKSALRSAALGHLREYADAGLGANAADAAVALDAIAADPTSSEAANQFATAATALDADMEDACDRS